MRAMTRKHFLVAGGTLVLLGMLGVHMGVNYRWWWLLIGVAAVVHVGAFTALIAWILRRVRGQRAEADASKGGWAAD